MIDREKRDFDQVREYTRIRRISYERFLETQDIGELKDRKEKLNE